MFLRLEKEKIKKIEKITLTDYEIQFDEFVSGENAKNIIDDLLLEIDRLTERKEDKEDYDTYMADVHYEDKTLGLI